MSWRTAFVLVAGLGYGGTAANAGWASHLSQTAVDYAPNGMPDFSQCRAEWSRAGSPGQWTHAGPVAVADALWWLDSVNEPGIAAPPTVSDSYPLVTAYPVFGPGHDDHDAINLMPLVNDLGLRLNTEGVAKRDDVRGTRWEDLVAGTTAYVAGRAASDWETVVADGADVAWANAQMARGGAVIALLGVWEFQPEGTRRVGGHYAAVVRVEGNLLVIADPLADRGDSVGGRWVPPDPALHSCREDPRAHDDAAVVSHDAYLLADAAVPGGRAVLSGYFTLDTQGEAAAFAGQNPAANLAEYEAPWTGGRVEMAVDAFMAISPREAPSATPSPSADAPASPTPTATATISPTPTATYSPPSETSSATPTSATSTATPQRASTITAPAGGTAAVPSYLPLLVTRR